MKSLKTSLFALAFLSITALSAQAAQLATAKVIDVVGTVTKSSPGGKSTPLSAGAILKEGDSIKTSALSKAELIFSNGSELTVQENTNIETAELKQEAYSGNKSYEQLQADPSKSQTILELNYGKLSGHVKQLRSDSKFHVESPLGTAAIRGTQWTAFFFFKPAQEVFLFEVKNIDGQVDIISRFAGQINYSESNVGLLEYDSTLNGTSTEALPATHTIVVRMGKGDPLFDNLVPAVNPPKVVTPGTVPENPQNEDFGITVVSPEGPAD